MLTIHRKELPFPDFEARVAAFRQAKLDHQKTTDVPAPQEHALVREAIKRVPVHGKPDNYVADYQIVEPTLAEKKQDLEHALHKDRDAVLFGKLSSAKRRALIYAVSDLDNKKKEALTDADKAILTKYDETASHDRRIERHATKLHVQIEDLTEATVDAWKPEAFPS